MEWLVNFVCDLKSVFEDRFTDLDKIENVIQLLNYNFSLKPNVKWMYEAAVVFSLTKQPKWK